MTHERTPSPLPLDGLEPALRDSYLAGTCTPVERRHIDAWISGDPARRAALAGLRQGLATSLEYPEFAPASELAARVTETVIAVPRKAGTLEQIPPLRLHRHRGVRAERQTPQSGLQDGLPIYNRTVARRWMGMSRAAWYTACGIGLSVLLVLAGWSSLTRSRVFRNGGPRNTALTTYVTRNGQRAEITLSDGSTVLLNVASRLDVPVDFAAGNRTLHVTGEALFTVAHTASAPFTVIAGTATARVLGTSFVVRHYPTDTVAVVAVRDGRVAVRSTILSAWQQAVIDARGMAHVDLAGPEQFGFATGVLTLDRLPLPAAIVELNRWYDADIRVADPSLLQARIRATFPAGALTDLSAMLEFMLGARVQRDGRILTIYPR